MDMHIVPGVNAKEVAQAHREDLMIEKFHQCKCMTYWIDETRGHIFCLIEAPHKEAVIEMHKNAHGLVPHKIIEVQAGIVESFLGRISDPENAETTEEGLKLINESSFRVILIIAIKDPVILQHEIGMEKANQLIQNNHDIISSEIKKHGGKETAHLGSELVISFTSASLALSCALAILQHAKQQAAQATGFKMAIHAGEPFSKADKLFEEIIQHAERICFITNESEICISSAVRELIEKEHLGERQLNFKSLDKADEDFLVHLFDTLDQNWKDTDFNVEDYCQKMAISKSRFYRKIISLTGLSPNLLLKDYRLDKARRQLRKRSDNISQVTFDAGFSSPSYFTKCFKKKYGILPLAYVEKLV